jgi:hypothetical protein
MLVILKEDLNLQNMAEIQGDRRFISEDHISRRAAEILARMREIFYVGIRG